MQLVTGPSANPTNDGIRGARGLAFVEATNDPLDPDGDWVRGYRFQRTACSGGDVGEVCSFVAKPAPDRSAGVLPPLGEAPYQPFVIRASRTCTARGQAAADYQAEARQLLNLVQFHHLGRELWRGDQARESAWSNRYLADDADAEWVNLVDVFGNPATDSFSPLTGLAAMEWQFAQCTRALRVIHAPPWALAYWADRGLLRHEGNRVFTPTGTVVVADDAYDGSGPDTFAGYGSANDPGTYLDFWIYGTGPVGFRLDPAMRVDPPSLAEAFDRVQNNVTFWAERLAAAAWDCCHFGLRIKAAGSTL